MVMKIYYTPEGKPVAAEPAEAEAWGLTPAQVVKTETQLPPSAGGAVVRGQVIQPAPPKVGTVSQPIGGTIEQQVLEESIEKAVKSYDNIRLHHFLYHLK